MLCSNFLALFANLAPLPLSNIRPSSRYNLTLSLPNFSGSFSRTYRPTSNYNVCSNYNGKFKFPTNKGKDTTSKVEKWQRKVIWFNPPFSKNVRTNVGRDFVRLINKHFPESLLHKIFNKNTVKLSYYKRNISNHNHHRLDKKTKPKSVNPSTTTDTPQKRNCHNMRGHLRKTRNHLTSSGQSLSVFLHTTPEDAAAIFNSKRSLR